MPKKTLTTLAVPSLPVGEYWDTVCSGLVLRVGAKRRSWAVRHIVGGKKRRDSLGHFPAVSLADARRRAGELLQRVEAGTPVAPREPHPRSAGVLSVAELLDRYEAMRRREGKRIKSLSAAMQILRRELKPYLLLPAKSFGKADIRAARDVIVERGNDAAAALFLRTLGPVLRWAATEDLIEVNHVPAIRKPATRSRDRVLTAAEIGRIWRGCGGFQTDSGRAFGRMVRFLLLTAQRREEAALLRHCDITDGTWHQDDNKSSRPHAVPLPALALEFIGSAEDRNSLVFRGRTGKLAGYSKLKMKLDALCGVKHWTLHDLRRTAATGMQDAGVSREVVDAVLNHGIPGVGGVYMRAQMEQQKRAALDNWADNVAKILGTSQATIPPLDGATKPRFFEVTLEPLSEERKPKRRRGRPPTEVARAAGRVDIWVEAARNESLARDLLEMLILTGVPDAEARESMRVLVEAGQSEPFARSVAARVHGLKTKQVADARRKRLKGRKNRG